MPAAAAHPHAPDLAGKRQRALEASSTALVRRYFDQVLSDGDVTLVPELFADDYVGHDPSLPPLLLGSAGVALHAVATRVAFPDQRATVDDTFTAGDRVAVRFTVHGTHLGSLLDVAPTGKRVAVQGVAIYRVAGGKIAEGWVGFDLLGLLGQLGLLERLGAPAGAERPPAAVSPGK